MTDQNSDFELPVIFKSDMPEPAEFAAQFKTAFKGIYAKIESEIEGADVDLTTVKGRKSVASLAFKISKMKVGMEKAANKLTEDQKAMVSAVIAERKEMTETLDRLRDKARKPLSDWEAGEEKRIDGLKSSLEYLLDLGRFDVMSHPDEIKAGIDSLSVKYAAPDWAEYQDKATTAYEAALLKFGSDLSASEKRIEDEVELAELRKIKADQERKEQAEREAQERRDKAAKIEAEDKERQRLAQEQADKRAEENIRIEEERAEKAIADAKQAEADLIAAKEKSEADKVAAEKKAEYDKAEAIKADRERVKAEEATRIASEKAAADERAADLQHRKKINGAALKALMVSSEISEEQGKMIIKAIAKGQIPHVEISY